MASSQNMHDPFADSLKKAQEASRKAAEKFDYVQHKVADDRAALFEKFALLNGGALVLSISLLSYLAGRHPNGFIYFQSLHAAWGCLLFGMLAAIFRNELHQRYIYDSSFSRWAKRFAELKTAEADMVRNGIGIFVDENYQRTDRSEWAAEIEEGQKGWSSRAKDAEQDANRFERLFVAAERASQVCFVLGVSLMIFFSVANIP